MRLEYISHSCFVIESGSLKIAFDPWISGSAYHHQWYLYPKPVNIHPVVNADIILISHGHEDHLHHESLELINKSAHIFFPFQWRDGIKGYLEGLLFESVTEAVSFKTYQVENLLITYLGYSLESVIVLEVEGYVIVNINDALNSNHEIAVEFLLEKIKTRWNKIDFLLSGWSGAGYFPNKVHYAGKDDLEVARIREQYFADNFCKFTKYLQPRIAVPFAPGFVLLGDGNRWINEIKFPRQIVNDYYHDNFEKDSGKFFPKPYPGDYFLNDSFQKVSEYHHFENDHEIYLNLDIVFKEEIKLLNQVHHINENEVDLLMNKLSFWLNKNKELYPPEVYNDAIFSIKMEDCLQMNVLNIFCVKDEIKVVRSDAPATDDRLIITSKGALISRNLDKMWGGDLLSIGYGIDVEVFDERSLEKNLDIVCVRLISRYPIFKDDVMKNATRVFKYYFNNPSLTNLWIKQKIKLRPYVNKYPFNERDHWITYNKCDLCQVCKMPQLDFEILNKSLMLSGNGTSPEIN